MNYEIFLQELNDAGREQASCLSAIVAEVKPQRILEIGSGWGVSACSFLWGNEATLLTIDPIANLSEFDRRVDGMGLRGRITRMIGRSSSPPPKCEKEQHHLLQRITETFDLIFVDGSHDYLYVKEDLLNCWPKAKRTIILDDYYHEHNWTGKYGVARAVCEVAKEKKVGFRVYPAAHGIARFDL